MNIKIKFEIIHRHGVGDCSKCPSRSTCNTLCSEAEAYVNQDMVEREEDLGIDYNSIVTDFRQLQGITKSNDETILELYFVKRQNMTKIGKIIGVSQPYVSQVIKKYRNILVKNLKKELIPLST